jgi:hypothetical protein
MAITRNIGRIGNQMRVTGTLTCTASGDQLQITDTNSRLATFSAFNSDGQESPLIALNVSDSSDTAANGSVYMVHGGSNGDVWNYDATFV